jgi:hypothetical protein
MSTETRYRRLLRCLPAWYRERYADEMVDVYLAGRPGDDDARPGAGEVAATLRLSVTTRLRAVGAPSAATLWLVALVATAALATQATRRTISGAIIASNHETSWTLDASGRLVESSYDLSFLLVSVLVVPGLAWLLVLVVMVVGWRRLAIALGALVALFDVSTSLSPLAAESAFLDVAITHTNARAVILPLVTVGALALAGRAPGTVPGFRARAAATGATVIALCAAWETVASLAGGGWTDGTTWSVTAAAVGMAGVAVLVGARWLSPTWPATVLTSAVLVVIAGPLPSFRLTGLPVATWPGTLVAVLAAVLAALAWLLATDRRPPDHACVDGGGTRLVAG